MVQVNWTKLKSGSWCSLETVNLSNVTSYGVYIIWHGGTPSRVVRIGQGDVSSRLLSHRRDNAILAYRKFGPLMVTWAAVSASQIDGVERHLADRWKPLIGDAFPDVRPIAVNSPW